MTGAKRGMAAAVMAALAALVVSSCAPAAPAQRGASVRAGHILAGPQHPSLAQAIARGLDAGPLAPATALRFTLGLASRDPAGLDAALASGRRFGASQYAAQFGPDPAQVARVRSALTAAGISSEWQPGDASIAASGAVTDIERLLRVQIHSRIGPDGLHFYAPATPVQVSASLRPAVNSISGLDDYPNTHISAIRSANGVSPKDMLDFYDVTPLRNAHLDGSGMTVAFVEIDKFDPRMLDAYAAKFGLPAFDVSVRQDASKWGSPDAEAGEADLDLEIVHAMAPAAKLVVYYASPKGTHVDIAAQGAYTDFPQGAILSESLGACETSDAQNEANLVNDQSAKAAGLGWSTFVSTGDRGAFGCLPDGDFNTRSTNVLSGVPDVTAVGGTYALLSATGGYFKEAAWGQPIEQWGSGGGPSMFWPRPSWQVAPGTQNQFSNGKRQNPDISANADGQSGWDIFAGGQEQPVGGTSAAAPFWAGITALIDQDLKAKGLRSVGFANPALYTFAQNPAGLPQPPYHDVTVGTNLYYPATPGWDFATGLGTPDVGALAQDFEWYERAHPNG